MHTIEKIRVRAIIILWMFTGDFTEDDLHIQKEETDGYMLATLEDIQAFAKAGIFLHYDSIQEVFK